MERDFQISSRMGMGAGLALTIAVAVVCGSPSSVFATFHLMQIEQAIAGVNGDTTVQAIQLRTRSSFQNFVAGARIHAWDANGENPVLILDIPTDVANTASGARILIASPDFPAHTSPAAVLNFTMTNLIPESYLAAGSLTFEDDFGDPGTIVYWRLSWGGASYTGSTTGDLSNDLNGDFGPPFGGPLPSSSLQALKFQGAATARSTTNLADYALTAGAAVFNNTSGTSFTVIPPPPEPGDIDGDGDVDTADLMHLVECMPGPEIGTPPLECEHDHFHAADLDGDDDVDLQDFAEFQNLFPGVQP